MKKLHLTRFAAVATVALMGSTAAWADDTGWSVSDGTLTLESGQSSISITSEISGVTKVKVNRGDNSPLTAYSTIMLPVDVVLGDNDYVEAAYLPMDYNKGENTLTFSSAVSVLEANKPYIIKVNSSKIGTQTLEFSVKSGSSVKPTSAGEHSAAGSCFTMKGVYETKQWNGSGLTQDYGFSADNSGGATQGQFVRIENNDCNNGGCVTLLPARAYLTCTKVQAVKGLGKVASEESLPDVINVRFVDKDGGTLSIGKMNTKTGDIQMQDRYYDLKGRKLNGKPQNKVMYVNKKVIKH